MNEHGSGTSGELVITLPQTFVDSIADAVAARLLHAGATPTRDRGPLMTVDETAAYLRCSKQAVYDRVHQGVLKPLRDGKRLLFSRTAVDAYLEGRAA